MIHRNRPHGNRVLYPVRAFLALVPLLLAGCGSSPSDQSDGVANRPEQAVANRQQQPASGDATTADKAPPPSSTPAVDAGPALLPGPVRGRWTGMRDACDDKGAPMELSVTAQALIFHESVGRAIAVRARPDGRIAVDATFTGEGQSWTRTLTLHPSTDGQRLTVTDDGGVATRKRCTR